MSSSSPAITIVCAKIGSDIHYSHTLTKVPTPNHELPGAKMITLSPSSDSEVEEDNNLE